MVEKYAIVLWLAPLEVLSGTLFLEPSLVTTLLTGLAYFLIMTGLCFLCRALRIIEKSDINFFLVYTWVMGLLCVGVWYFYPIP